MQDSEEESQHMHRIRLIGRPAALLVVAAAMLAVVAWFSGSARDQDRALADFDWANQNYVTCADTYLDVPPLTTLGNPPGAEDLLTGFSMSRGEPSQTVPGDLDLTQAVYLGPNLDGDEFNIPDKGPGLTCAETELDGQVNPENNRLNDHLNYAIPSETRTFTADLVPAGPDTLLHYTTCTYSGTTEFWTKTVVDVVLSTKGPKSINYGIGTLYPYALSPSVPGDPTTCGNGTLSYNFVIVSHSRDATTDHPELASNADAIAAGDLIVDPDGPAKVKGTKQNPDGTDEVAAGPYTRGDPPHVTPMLSDDWDGDGCPDWDELDPTLNSGDATANGLDPFNPHDCNQAVNIGGIYRISATALPADKATPGAYFHCIGDMQQDGINVEMAMYCYTDSALLPVNPQAGPDTGDGYKDVPPPPPYGDVDDVQSVLTGTFNEGTNHLLMSGCYEDRDGHSAVGNVYIQSDQDAHTGRGTANIWLAQTTANCTGGTPSGLPTFADAPISSVKAGEKGPCDKDEPKCAAGGQIDTDGDNCPDKAELTNDQSHGGLRDPYNRWDYFNPTHDGLNRVDDILKVVGAYFCDEGSCPDYTRNTDRTAVVGANPWNLAVPNGQQRVDDILAAVKSYFHDCSGGLFDDPDDELTVE